MREALETISKCDISKEEDCYRLYRICDEALSAPPMDGDDLEVCSDYDESDEARREEREAYEVDKGDAKRKGEW